MEKGHTYKLAYGNGTQVFHVTRVTPKGKVYGWRLVGFGHYLHPVGRWDASSLPANDPRVIGECFLPGGCATLPLMHQKTPAETMKVLKARVDAAKAELRRVECLQYADTLERCKAHNCAFQELEAVKRVYHNAKTWNDLQD